MAEHRFYVPSISDKTIIGTFKKLYTETLKLEVSVARLQLSFQCPLNHTGITVGSEGELDKPELVILSKSNNFSITNATFSFSNYSINYQRSPANQEQNGHLGLVKVIVNAQIPFSIEHQQKLLGILNKGFLLNLSSSTQESPNTLESHSKVLSDMESLMVEMQEKTFEYRSSLEKSYEEKRESIESEHKEAIEEVKISYQKKLSDLETKEKLLDNRNNTHVRRDIRKQLNDSIRNRIQNFKSSDGVAKLRWPIHLAFILLIIFSGLGLLYFSKEFLFLLENKNFTSSNIAIFLGLLKPVTFTILFSSSFIFYIKWLNAWFSKNSDEEFFLRKYQLDVERSSWIVETVLESLNQGEKELPTELILNFSKNLFSEKDDVENDLKHPSDQLASAILGSAANAKIKIGQNEIELDRKSLKNLD